MDYSLVCTNCGIVYESNYNKQICNSCNGLLAVKYKHNVKRKLIRSSELRSFWDFEELLPKSKYKHYELGNTKLIKSYEEGEEKLYLKLEIDNPTHSFKDRGSVIEVTKAIEYGYDKIVCASTGNMAYSIAYYAKLSGIKSKIFISNNANKDKVKYIRETHDADITRVDGDFNMALKMAEGYSEREHAFLAGDYCYRMEGQRTIAYEIALQMKDVSNIIVPVGNATLLSGIIKAEKEMLDAGIIKKMPKIIGVEAERCAPLYKAFNNKSKVVYEKPNTKADAIAVGYPTFGEQSLELLRKYKGDFVAVSDDDMIREQKNFYNTYGLIAEMAGVASIAAFKKLKDKLKGKSIAIISGGNI
ncbi:MAG: pyridoxal-phosphate dependent enzyme [Candidatus Micrarchaeia archaeon]